jgi:hypothetical protein
MFDAFSSLVADGGIYFIPRMSEEESAAEARLHGLNNAMATRLFNWTVGARALVRALAVAAGEGKAGSDLANAARPVISRTLSELGPSIAASLDYWMNEWGLDSVGVDEIDVTILESLRSAGIAISNDGWKTVQIFGMPRMQSLWLEELRSYIDSLIDPQEEWSKIASVLFNIERKLRWYVKSNVVAVHGKGWRSNCIPTPVIDTVLDRAKVDLDRPVGAIGSIPNPLNYVTLASFYLLRGN